MEVAAAEGEEGGDELGGKDCEEEGDEEGLGKLLPIPRYGTGGRHGRKI